MKRKYNDLKTWVRDLPAANEVPASAYVAHLKKAVRYIDELLAERDVFLQAAFTLKRQANELAAKNKEIERLKETITNCHNLSYPGLAVKESVLLNKIYELTAADLDSAKEGE